MTGKGRKPKRAAQRTGAEADRIARAIREEILGGGYGAGDVLRQERLAEVYDASRMPVRDALRMLENQGLVVVEPNRGAVVAGLDPQELREIYEMRVALETLALRLAIPELTNRQLDEIAAVQDRAEAAGLAEFGSLNRVFHLGLYAPSGRPRLLAQIALLNDIADRYLRVTAAQLDYAGRSHREHRRLLDACRRRDTDAALACLHDHIADAGRSLFEVLSRRGAL
ncbi:MAG: GntR family transcriptional regulator [Hyphomicrobiales bacterium]|nr:GntR family transcriptional regulator [Hyphomicrobiales bacterium]